MPFASIVGLLYIWLMDGQEFQQLSEAYRADPNGTRLCVPPPCVLPVPR